MNPDAEAARRARWQAVQRRAPCTLARSASGVPPGSGRTTDALVQAVLIKGAMHFRQADAPADDARVFLPESHRVSFAVLAGVRSLAP